MIHKILDQYVPYMAGGVFIALIENMLLLLLHVPLYLTPVML